MEATLFLSRRFSRHAPAKKEEETSLLRRRRHVLLLFPPFSSFFGNSRSNLSWLFYAEASNYLLSYECYKMSGTPRLYSPLLLPCLLKRRRREFKFLLRKNREMGSRTPPPCDRRPTPGQVSLLILRLPPFRFWEKCIIFPDLAKAKRKYGGKEKNCSHAFLTRGSPFFRLLRVQYKVASTTSDFLQCSCGV